MTFSIVLVDGGPGRVIPELDPHATAANTFERGPASPLLGGPPTDALAANGRRTLVIAGFATEVMVMHAVLDVITAGYVVKLPVDAIGGMSARTEEACLRQILKRGRCLDLHLDPRLSPEPDFAHPPSSLSR